MKKIIPKRPYHTRGHYVTKHAVFDMNKRNISVNIIMELSEIIG